MPIQVNPEREKLWQQVKQEMQGIYQDPTTKKYQINYSADLLKKLNDLPDDLYSEKNIDYKPLRDLLIAGKWNKADYETLRVLFLAADYPDPPGFDSFDYASIKEIPCADLRTIDRLWVKYSKGRYGFSVQQQFWLKCGIRAYLPSENEKSQFALGWNAYDGGLSGNKVFSVISDSVLDPSTNVLGHLPFLERIARGGRASRYWVAEGESEFLSFAIAMMSEFALRLVTCKI